MAYTAWLTVMPYRGGVSTRGRSTNSRYFFPVGYRPGALLADYFRTTKPRLGQTSAAWWGNDREHKRHQEYTAWKRGGHAHSLRHLKEDYDGRYGKVTPDCLRCHTAETATNPHRKRTLDTVEHGITCAVCHNIHGGLDRLRLGCDFCYEQGAFYHHLERNADHVICGDQAEITCVDCHMPLTARNGGGLNLHTHYPGIIPPWDTSRYGVPSSCATGPCHADRQTEWLQSAFERHYRPSPARPDAGACLR